MIRLHTHTAKCCSYLHTHTHTCCMVLTWLYSSFQVIYCHWSCYIPIPACLTARESLAPKGIRYLLSLTRSQYPSTAAQPNSPALTRSCVPIQGKLFDRDHSPSRESPPPPPEEVGGRTFSKSKILLALSLHLSKQERRVWFCWASY